MVRQAWRRDLVTALIGLWIVAGIFTDGWAHVHIPELETFFTPWHASFYSGLVAFVVWLVVVAVGSHQPGDTPQQALGRLPAGYRGAVAGAAIFAVGGAADMLWHTLLGIEASIDALLSPPHLMLLTGVLLMTTTGWRAQRAVSATSTLPELISLTSAVAICGFFLNYLSPFRYPAPLGMYAQSQDGEVMEWIGGLLVTTALIVIPLLWQLRDARHRPGTFAAFLLVVGFGDIAAMSRYHQPGVLYAGLASAVLVALVAEFGLRSATAWWRHRSYGLPLLIGVSVFAVWAAQLAGMVLDSDEGSVGWPVTLWLGYLIITAGAAAALASTVTATAPAPATESEISVEATRTAA